jgi:ferredoxin
VSVNINLARCIGCGVCYQVCPAVFGLDEDEGKAVLKETEAGADSDKSLILEAVDCCPIGCINY